MTDSPHRRTWTLRRTEDDGTSAPPERLSDAAMAAALRALLFDGALPRRDRAHDARRRIATAHLNRAA